MNVAELVPVKRRRIVKTYDYTDEEGVLLYQAVRYEPKDFKQRRPDASKPGGWNWSMKGVRLVLYRLPELIDAVTAGHPVFVVEGEKDADAMHRAGLTATCNVGGACNVGRAGKWKAEFAEFFKGATVCVIADKDDAGREHAQQVAANLYPVAKHVVVIELPDIGEAKVKDAADYLGAGGLAADITALAGDAPPWTRPALEGVKPAAFKLAYVKPLEEANKVMLHSCSATHAALLPSYSATDAVVGSVPLFQSIEDIVQYSLPSTTNRNHKWLWKLARGNLNLELIDGKSSPEKLTQIFDRWYLLATPHLDKELSRDRYFMEFMGAYANAKIPLGEDGVTEAWKRAQQKPLPPEALAAFTDHKLRMVVALCRELQIVWGDKPFPLSCRTLASLLGKETYMTTSRWLTALCAMGFLKLVEKGTQVENGKASTYRYLKSLS